MKRFRFLLSMIGFAMVLFSHSNANAQSNNLATDPTDPALVLTKLEIEGDGMLGTKHVVRAWVKNDGADFKGRVSYFASLDPNKMGTSRSTIISTIQSGQNAQSFAWQFIPDKAGTYTIWVGTSNDSGQMVEQLGTTTFQVKSPSSNISFADAEVKRICVKNWDTDGDGELSEEEAAAVTDIGTKFQYNMNITSFDELNYFTALTKIDYYSFYGCRNLRSIKIPEGVNTINSYAFYECENLAEIVLPNSLVYLLDDVFNGCNSLTSVTIPKNVYAAKNTIYCSSSFPHCENLAEIKVDPENPYMEAIDNVLYLKKYPEILQYPAGKRDTEYEIRDGATILFSGVFAGCKYLKSIKIPESVTTINGGVFKDCTGLTELEFPQNLKFDGYGHIMGCTNLQKIISHITNPIDLHEQAFDVQEGTMTNATLYVPAGTKALYQQKTEWKDFQNIVEMEPAPELVLTSLTIEGDGTLGTEHIVRALVKNDGGSFRGRVSYFASLDPNKMGTSRSTIITTIASGEKDHSFAWQFIPDEAGTYTIWVGTSNDSGQIVDVLGSTTIQVKSPVANISFADAEVKRICVENWDTDGDGELSEEEAAAVESIGTVFEENEMITNFDEFQYFTGVTSIEEWAFSYCSSLTSITIPESVTSIGDYAFYHCSSLTFITIPKGVTSIGDCAFALCSGRTSITILDGLTSIGSGAFGGWRNLTEIEVNKNNPNYQSIDGVLYSKDMKTIVAYPAGKEQTEFTIPSSVTGIGVLAFLGCSSLKSITIPESVTYIGFEAFDGCSSLTAINIPEGVTSIDRAFDGCSSLTAINIPESVTSIGYATFAGCSSLTSITIPEGVTSIGNYAFWKCSSLTSITIPEGVTSIGSYAFLSCSSLEEVVSYIEEPFAIDDDVFQIYVNGEYQFTSATLYVPAGTKEKYQQTDGWKNFQNIVEMGESSDIIQFADAEVKRICVENWDTDGDGELSLEEAAAVESIGTVFKSNKTITSFDEFQYFTGVTSIGDYAFVVCSSLTSITIPEGVTSIGFLAFGYCSSLTSITIPKDVTSIEFQAFSDCSSLTSITIPEGVTSIGKYAFNNCTSLTSITIPEGVTTIGAGAFAYCINLPEIEVNKNNPNYQSVDGVVYSKDMKTIVAYPAGKKQTEFTIPSSVTNIGERAFEGCSSLSSITIPEGVTSIGELAFYGCSSLTSITIPEGVTSIGEYAFYECSSLTSITIPEGVTSIEQSAFDGCSNLTSITIPEGVTSIGSYAFVGCSSLTSITIPKDVTSIGENAFYGCSSLEEVVSYIEEPFAITDNVFQIYVNGKAPFTSATLYVPAGTKAKYQQTDGWKNFQNIVEMGEPVQQDNMLSIPDIAGVKPGTEFVLPIALTNADAISGFQFDLHLPEGMTLATDEYGDALIELASRTTSKRHSVSMRQQSDGSYRIIVTSVTNATFSGNNGEVVSISILPSKQMESGDYEVALRNIILTDPSAARYEAPDAKCTVTLSDFTMGDVNSDGHIDVADLSGVVRFILEDIDESLTFSAADMDGNGVIEINDYSALVNVILNQENNGVKSRRSPALMEQLVSLTSNGEGELLVNLLANRSYTGMQFDLTLPEGARLSEDDLDAMSAQHGCWSVHRQDGSYRIVCASASNAELKQGTVLRLHVEGNAEGMATMSNVVLSDTKSVRHEAATVQASLGTETSIAGIASGKMTVKGGRGILTFLSGRDQTVQVYSMNGMSVAEVQLTADQERRISLPAGIYVVENKKVIVR